MRKYLYLTFLLISLCVPQSGHSEGGDSHRISLTTEFIYNITKFVHWPNAAEGEQSDSITLCFANVERWQHQIKAQLQGKKSRRRQVITRFPDSPDQYQQCQLLFIGQSEHSRYFSAISNIPAQGVLTIGENDDFMQHGGMFRFFTQRNQLRFEVNPVAAEQAGLKISSKLIQLGMLYEPPDSNIDGALAE